MIRPVDSPVGQGYGANPTKHLPASSEIIRRFGNYQPDGHAGEDYPVGVGTLVRAVTSGVVVHVGYYTGAYWANPYWIAPNFAGYCYVVKHDATAFVRAFTGIYAHCMEYGARVRVGQRVTEGQILGPSGNTGGSTGPHLHFEILLDGFNLNGPMYGRSNPAILFNTLSAQGAIDAEQDDLMATKEQRAELIAELMTHPVKQTIGGTMTLGELLAEHRGHHLDQLRVTESVSDKVLDTVIPRGGVMGGETTLRGMVAWNDDHVISLIDALAKATGADVNAIKQAVIEGIQSGIKVDVTINGGK